MVEDQIITTGINDSTQLVAMKVTDAKLSDSKVVLATSRLSLRLFKYTSIAIRM